ncbi:hypothetical protein DICPUDRAFT_157723 [Dictyostelium purpureum]|uniref:Uncharacterized protein n=1 Tax=Dictyostelium purpureum TaxID=5786 RepID=F0ZZU6_DICPU|nr:uncharacterized protein DICPUDRAFT_157723 [Dictyostelium purpureum]EGC30543.1 hypothetical protein DICPUDRAFT_157723 [Dictyostelium purpureum]|eukprot:XP_003292938.1 hypothetical protein DICPUDRAFT_157723 [Dictyostelium purpureum]
MEINLKLNSLVFNEVLPYLLYNNNYKRILELSLISKQSFQIIQNLLTHKHIIKIKPNNLINSIKKSRENNKYELFLIKYKELESIHFKHCNIYSKKKFKKIKSELLEQCEQLKKVIFNNTNVDTMASNPTYDNFYEFRGLDLYWNSEDRPWSNETELKKETLIIDDSYIFSFEFLSRYPNSKKISISLTNCDSSMCLENLDGILKNCCSTVESIKFYVYNTPHNFVGKVINSKSPAIKSFTVRLANYDTSKLVANLFRESEISKNNILKVLKLKYCEEISTPYLNQEPTEFLETLIGNQTLETLGLELFKVSNSEKLSPLIQVPNITTLICNFNSFDAFLLHCNENHNITTLKAGWDAHQDPFLDDNIQDYDLVNALSNFFKNNKSSLHSIIFYRTADDLKGSIIKERNNINNNIKNITFKILDPYSSKEIIL